MKDADVRIRSARTWFVLFLLLSAIPLAAKTLCIRAGKVFNGTEILEHRLIVIDGDRIVNILPWDVMIPTTPDLIDASNGTVVPGFIDCHTQSMAASQPYLDNIERSGTGRRTAEEMSAYRESRLDLLRNGVTTVMEFGWPLGICSDMRKALNKGSIVGPELYYSGPIFTDGSIPPEYVGNHDLIDQGIYRTTDTAQTRAEVAALAVQGVDFIALDCRGRTPPGGSPKGSDPFGHVRTIIDEAHKHGLRVFAQTVSEAEVRALVSIGVDGIDGDNADWPDSLLPVLATNNVLLTTLAAPPYRAFVVRPRIYSQFSKPGGRPVQTARICMGSGFPYSGGAGPGDAFFRELRAREAAGASRLAILRAATSTAATKLGKEDDLGRVSPGARANLIIYDGSIADGELSAGRITEVILHGAPVIVNHQLVAQYRDRFKENSLSALPYPYWDPVLSYELGGNVTDVDFLHSGVSVSATVMASFRNMWFADLAADFPSPIPRTALKVVAHFDNQNRLYYGIGNDRTPGDTLQYANLIFKEGVSGLTRITKEWKLATALLMDQTTVRLDDSLTLLPEEMGKGGDEAVVSLSLIHDGRENKDNPWYGHYVSLTGQVDPGFLPGGHSFRRVLFDVRGYVSPFHKHILAGRLLYQQAFGDAPFYYLPEIGGDTLGRGFVGYRFRDRIGIYGQFEYRFPIYRFVSGVAFLDLGRVQPTLSRSSFIVHRSSFMGMHPGFGIGPRFSFGSNDGSIIGIDLGFTPEGWNLCLHNGHVF
jgi:imidazolonepropionase-like amidohydrolase